MVVVSIFLLSSVNLKIDQVVLSGMSLFAACRRKSIWFDGVSIAMESQRTSLLGFVGSPCLSRDAVDDVQMLTVVSMERASERPICLFAGAGAGADVVMMRGKGGGRGEIRSRFGRESKHGSIAGQYATARSSQVEKEGRWEKPH